MSDEPTPQWWSHSGDHLMLMLRRVANGEDPDLVYLEEYVNSDITPIDDDD